MAGVSHQKQAPLASLTAAKEYYKPGERYDADQGVVRAREDFKATTHGYETVPRCLLVASQSPKEMHTRMRHVSGLESGQRRGQYEALLRPQTIRATQVVGCFLISAITICY